MGRKALKIKWYASSSFNSLIEAEKITMCHSIEHYFVFNTISIGAVYFSD